MQRAIGVGCCALATLVACGGGGGNSGSTPSVVASGTPDAAFTAVPQATLAPFTAAATSEAVPVPASTSAAAPPITIPLPSTASVVEEMDLDADGAQIDDGTTVDVSASNEPLTDAPAPTDAGRATADVRAIDAKAIRTHIETVGIKFSKTVALTTRPTFVFTFAGGFLTTANYYLQYYDTSKPGLGWQDPFEGPATISGSTLLFVDSKNAFTFAAGVKYYFDLYDVSVRSTPTPFPATPTPVATGPTSTPLPAPSPIFGLLSVTPTTVAFVAAGQIETLAVSEDGYTGSFSAKVSAPALATVSAAGAGTILVTAGSSPGRSSVVVSDEHGQTVTIPFTVTITTGTISAVRRQVR